MTNFDDFLMVKPMFLPIGLAYDADAIIVRGLLGVLCSSII